MSINKQPKKRRTVQKQFSALMNSGDPIMVTLSGRFKDPAESDAAAELLKSITRASSAPLVLGTGLEHPFPEIEKDRDQFPEKLRPLLEVLCRAFENGDPGPFEMIAKALRGNLRHKAPQLGATITSLLVEAQKGPVNVRVLAFKLATGRDRPPGAAKEYEGPYEPGLQEQLDKIPALEKKLHRYCKQFRIPVVEPGRPKKPDK